ncbi:MAG: trypsin-like peptidase domain-containing protein [Lachnospiraceae bacterium]|nr:trypsin-like peptidase domain-containing protein [Lachnospiraceae bacterium]
MSEEFENKNGQEIPGEAAPKNPSSSDGENQEATTYSWVNPKVNPSASDTDSEIAKHAAENVSSGYNGAYTGSNGYTEGNNSHTVNSQTPGNGYDNAANTAHGYSAYQFGNQNQSTQAGPTHSFHESHPQHKAPKQHKPMTTGKRWTANVAMALVFGLVAGSVAYGVNYAGNKLNGDGSATPVIQSTTVAGTKDSSSTVSATASKDTSSLTVKEVAANAMPSMVAISTETVSTIQSFFGTYAQTVPASGTGVIVGQNDNELLIATNNHVIEGANSVSVAFIDETAVSAEIKGTDSQNDLAVVAVKLSDISEDTMKQIKIATLGNSDDLSIGENVVAIGNALGYGQSVTTGIVSALDRSVQAQSESTGEVTSSDGLIQTDAAINPGNSGGALLNMNGELIGINEAKYSDTSVEGVGFAIPLAKAEPILQNLMTMETRTQVADDQSSYIGISGVNVSAEMNSSYGVPVGVYVESLEEGGPAETAGIQSKDVITKLDTRSVTTMTELQNALKYYAKGETVDVVVQRMENGEYAEKTISVTLGDKSKMKTTSEESSQNNSGQNQQNNIPFGN